ncbi:lysozyme family protein [Photobacterium leiognathi]|uniref:hypothetical protein n=1 Tax=Photobacterium leiognathi TaxID=553611 RepID=UPI002980E82F|nr:hypothetical protein [Photobacterium leiognathi]
MGIYRAIVMIALCGISRFAEAGIPPLYTQVAQQHGVPPSVLYSLALTESNKRLDNGNVRPWPWTLNVKGRSYYYATRTEACRALNRFLTTTRIVDIGLTQQNWRYQGDHFSSPCAVFEPVDNLTHAARLLREGYRVHGSWVGAAGWFHRPAGGALAEKYKRHFLSHYRKVNHES